MRKRGFQSRSVTVAKTVRTLVIVARSHARLYQHLKQDFADIETILVILDRRFGERRQRRTPFTPERRRETRRRAANQLSEAGGAVVSLRGFPQLTPLPRDS